MGMEDDRVELLLRPLRRDQPHPRSRLRDDPRCGRCKESVFPDRPVAATDATWKREVEDCPIPVAWSISGPHGAALAARSRQCSSRQRRSGRGKLKIVKLNVDEKPADLRAAIKCSPISDLDPPARAALHWPRGGALPKSELDAFIDRYV